MKKLVSILMCLCLILSTFTFVGISASAENENGLYYTVESGKATIIDCSTSISGAITIPSTLGGYPVKSIGNHAFYNCDLLTSMSIPDSVTSIGNYAFEDCDLLTSVSIPDSVTSIGNYAFEDCDLLTSVSIPDSVTSIGSSAFYGTAYYNNESNWENDVLYICNHLIEAKETLSGHYTIKNGTKLIANYAFEYCDSLTSVSIPDSVTSIGYYAFRDCTSLTSITIGNSVTSIGEWAFSGCGSLEKVNITDIKAWCEIDFESYLANPLYYAGNLYLNGELLKGDLVIPNGTKSIGNGAFYNCSSLTSVTIPDSVTSIGNYAFEDCDSLISVTIPDSVTSIGDYAFEDCDSLISVTIPDSVTSIGDYAFEDCDSLTSVTIGDSVTSIGDDAFGGCYYLNEIIISKGTKKITKLMCLNTNISSVLIPDTVTTIEEDAFYRCKNLKSVYIPSSVTEIGAHAFGYFDTGESFDGYDKVDGFAIYGKKGSAAETYAKNNGFKFAEEKHNEVIDEAVEPNCTETGLTEGSHCSACGKVIEAQKVVPAVGHEIKTVGEIKATYFKTGYSGDKVCKVCGEEVSQGKVTAKLKLKTPTVKLTGGKKKLTIKYTKVKDATGFEIKYTFKNKARYIKVNTKKSMSKIIKNLKKGKYRIQVRAFIKKGNKTAYSIWTKAKTITVK